MWAIETALAAVIVVLAGIGAGFLIGLAFYSSTEDENGDS